MRLVKRFIRLTLGFSFSFSFLSPCAGGIGEAASAPIAILGGGLIKVVALGERAGAGAGVVAKRATTAAGTEAELEVPPDKGLYPVDTTTGFNKEMLGDDPDPGLKALGGSFGGGCAGLRLETLAGVD